MTADTTRTFIQLIAPVWFGLLWLGILATGIAAYGAAFILLGVLLDAIAPWLEPLASLAFFAPPALALWLFRRASSSWYARDRGTHPTILNHAWQCVLLYAVLAWTIYALSACSSGEPPIIRSYCADPLGVGLAGGLVALGGIVGDLMALREATRRRSDPGAVPP